MTDAVTGGADALTESAVLAGGLAARYAQPHRAYHTIDHVHDVLRRIDELSPPPDSLVALRLAAWFHDAIYAPGRSDNETRSAFLAKETLEIVGASPDLRSEVARLVTLTATHEVAAEDKAGAVLCDADLGILASSEGDYAAYRAAIREEYSLIPDEVFQPARARILRAFLERESIFATSTARESWESLARENITREIRELEGAVA